MRSSAPGTQNRRSVTRTARDSRRMNVLHTLDAKLLPLFHSVLADSMHYAAQLRFNKEHPQHLTLICLYCTIIELAHGEKVLMEDKDSATSMPVLFRSILEAYADLLAV